MARDVNASINKCEKAIAQEEVYCKIRRRNERKNNTRRHVIYSERNRR